VNTDLKGLSDAEFSDELDRRIGQVDAAWKAVREAYGMHLEGLATQPLPTTAAESNRLWAEMEGSERELEDAWQELYRRRDIRLGR
jgi:hypothetical protein